LGRQANRDGFVLAVLEVPQRAVIDADALTVLADRRDALAEIAGRGDFVLTPHRGEFRALFPEAADAAATDPWAAAQHAVDHCGATVVLKGVPTVVASAGSPALTIAAGNPGLATGGSGDVLSGVIGVFLAQGLAPRDAAAVAAQALGEAATFAGREHGPRAMRPLHVVSALAQVWQVWTIEDQPPDEDDYPAMTLAELFPPLTG
jgi:hydroxyethylthiazole kinase-like uncharacterized protein yjeF